MGVGLSLTFDGIDSTNLGKSRFSSHREEHCPLSLLSLSSFFTDADIDASQKTRQEFVNGEEKANLLWIDTKGNELFVAQLLPFEFFRVNTFIGAQFVVRSTSSEQILLHLQVGVHKIHLPKNLNCTGMKRIGEAGKT